MAADGSAASQFVPTAKDPQQIALVSALSGDKFKDLFYSVCDTHREEIINFYKQNSILIWGGQKNGGCPDLRTFWKKYPPTKHEIHSLDAQPVNVDLKVGNVPGSAAAIVVSVVGDVRFGIETRKRGFRHTFVLERDVSNLNSNLYYILSHTFRDAVTTPAISSQQQAAAVAAASAAV